MEWFIEFADMLAALKLLEVDRSAVARRKEFEAGSIVLGLLRTGIRESGFMICIPGSLAVVDSFWLWVCSAFFSCNARPPAGIFFL